MKTNPNKLSFRGSHHFCVMGDGNTKTKGLFGFFFFSFFLFFFLSSLITSQSIFVTHHLKYPNFLYPPVWHTSLSFSSLNFLLFYGTHGLTWCSFYFILFFSFHPQYPNSPNPVKKKKEKKKTKPDLAWKGRRRRRRSPNLVKKNQTSFLGVGPKYVSQKGHQTQSNKLSWSGSHLFWVMGDGYIKTKQPLIVWVSKSWNGKSKGCLIHELKNMCFVV